jgi:hypothetical protein
MAEYYNGLNISLNMRNDEYNYIAWPNSVNSVNNYEDDAIKINNLRIG